MARATPRVGGGAEALEGGWWEKGRGWSGFVDSGGSGQVQASIGDCTLSFTVLS